MILVQSVVPFLCPLGVYIHLESGNVIEDIENAVFHPENITEAVPCKLVRDFGGSFSRGSHFYRAHLRKNMNHAESSTSKSIGSTRAAREKFWLKKGKEEITIRSSTAEYLTYAASVGDQQDSVEMRYEER